jgi:hypothetical protein
MCPAKQQRVLQLVSLRLLLFLNSRPALSLDVNESDWRGITPSRKAERLSIPLATKEERTLTGSPSASTWMRFWLRGVDLNPSPALILRKLLILQYAKLAQLAQTANLSYTFLTLSVFAVARLFHAHCCQRAFLALETMSIVAGSTCAFKLSDLPRDLFITQNETACCAWYRLRSGPKLLAHSEKQASQIFFLHSRICHSRILLRVPALVIQI